MFCSRRFFSSRIPPLSLSSINPSVIDTRYEVRGKVLDRAMEIGKQLKSGVKFPFNRLISCNIGNPHALRQPPLSFVRDVVSLVLNPGLESHFEFPSDVIERAQKFREEMPSIGAYSNSQGISVVREQVADFIERRDNYPSNPDDIFLTNGASEGVRFLMNTILRKDKKDGILIPIPQYPLYSALTTLLDGTLVPYYLNESENWGLSVSELERNLDEFKEKGIDVRALVVINPGNPTGQVLSESNMRNIIQFCVDSNLVLFADEVYQENIWKDNTTFTSFKKVARDMEFDGKSDLLQMVSFHSISKGFLGECGLRGGYFELFGVENVVKQQLYKLASVSLCSNTIGQITTGIMVNPPRPEEPSFQSFVEQRDAILQSMKRRAALVSQSLNQLQGISCNPSDGAMYVFPQLDFPLKFLQEAKRIEGEINDDMPPDLLYCLQLLEETGIITVPGSGFKQKKGTWHLRTTILPPEDEMEYVMHKFSEFHKKFLQKYQ